MEKSKEFYAFISYKREDEKWAKWLQDKLEHYKFPTNLNGRTDLPKNIRPTFRDVTDLKPGLLAEEINNALCNSEWLIVVCSPRSAKSPWVCKEAQTFIDLGRADHIIPFVIEGAPFSNDTTTECYPEALLNLTGSKELLAANVNEGGRDYAAVKVVAKMFDLKPDTLWQRFEREQRRKRWMWIGGSILIALLGLSIGGYFFQLNREIKEQSQHIERQNERLQQDSIKMVNHLLHISAQNDSIASKNNLILSQRDSIEYSLQQLQLSNKMLANEKQTVLAQYARLVAARAEERIKDNDYLTARRLLMEVLPQREGGYNFPYIPEVERALRKSFENSSCVINAHINSVSDIALSPNGQYIVSCADKEDIKIWNMKTGLLYGLIPNKEFFISIMFSPNGFLYTSSDSIRVWSLTPLRRIVSFKGTNIKDIDEKNRILSVISHSNHQDIVITDGMTGKQLTTFPVSSNSKLITSATFLPDNKIATASLNDSILIWDINTKSLIKGWRAHTYGVGFLHKSSNGDYLLSGEFGMLSFQDGLISNDSLTIWDTHTGNIISKYPYHVNDALFCPNNKGIITRTGNTIDIIDFSSGKKTKTLIGHKSNITKIGMDKKGRLIVSASSDGTIRLWDEKLYEPTTKKQVSTRNYSIPVAIHPNGKSFLISIGDSIMALSTNPYKAIKRFGKKIPFKISSIRYNKDGNKFITTDANATLWSSTDYTQISTIRSFRPVYAEICPDGSKALTVQWGNTICIWDISKGDSVVSKHLAAFKSGTGSNRVNMASFSPDGKHIVTANSDGIIRIWDVDKQICIDSLIGHKGSINSAFYNPQGNYIVSASSDKTIRIWNTKTHSFRTLAGHTYEVSYAEFSSDGKYVISTSLDNVCKIWDIKTGISLKTEFSNNSWSALNDNMGIYIITDYPNGVTLKPFPSYQSLINRVQNLFAR